MTAMETRMQWDAGRMLFEGAPVTFEMLAQLIGRQAATVAARAAREGWKKPDEPVSKQELRDRLTVQMARMIGEIEMIGVGEGEGPRFDKTRIDAVSAMMRALEKMEEIMRGWDSAREGQADQDADMAGILGRIDQRIVELARDYAAQLGFAPLHAERG